MPSAPIAEGFILWLVISILTLLIIMEERKSLAMSLISFTFSICGFIAGIVPMPYVFLADNLTIVRVNYQFAPSGEIYVVIAAISLSLMMGAIADIVDVSRQR